MIKGENKRGWKLDAKKELADENEKEVEKRNQWWWWFWWIKEKEKYFDDNEK